MSEQHSRGAPCPLGAAYLGDGQTRFAVFSAHAESISVCLFDGDSERSVDLVRGDADVWQATISGVAPGQRYGLRAHGPYDPAAGQRFNRHKLLVDPYAKALAGELTWHPALFGYDVDSPAKDLSFSTLDSAPYVPKSVVVQPGGGAPSGPRNPPSANVIYELHVRGFTRLHPELPTPLRGTYEGLAHPAALNALAELGVTAVELLPVQAFVDERPLLERGLKNYWGYNPLNFFAPDHRYARLDPAVELRAAIAALHSRALDVFLDVVFNHTCEGDESGPTLSLRGLDNSSYYRLASDPRRYLNHSGCGNTLNFDHPRVVELATQALRHWVDDYDIDGFRFDLATTLGREHNVFHREAPFFRAVAADPRLASRRLIAEPWDLGPDGYRLGRFPPPWAEWNDRFRDTVRRYWKGDPGMLAELSKRLHGSADLTGGKPPASSVNYIASHDGFTLADLTCYAGKHNLANGESNRDGSPANHSDNHGVEGPSDDPRVRAARQTQVRNLLTTLFCAHGTPMLAAGDEFGRSQHGNNNAYCQDNELSWLDWERADSELRAYVASLIAFRRRHPALRQTEHPNGEAPGDRAFPPIAWFRADGAACDPAYWDNPHQRLLTVVYCAPVEADSGLDDVVALALNASRDPVTLSLPKLPEGWAWTLALTSGDDPGSVADGLLLRPRSCALLSAAPANTSGR